ncbi:MAG: CBS domain-containing protein [Polyangiaceae bacterium]
MSALFSTPVREYMSKSLVSVRPDAPLQHVLDTLGERDVSSVAVTAEDGSLVGIVSLTDLLRIADIQRDSPRSAPVITAPARVAADILRAPVVTVDEAESVAEAASRMVASRIHRVIVLRRGRPVAVFSTRDMMRVVLFHHIETPLAELMRSPVETVEVGAPIDEAIDRLARTSVRGLAVVDAGYPVGVFTQIEALTSRALPAEVRRMPVEEVMSYKCVILDARSPLYRVAGRAVASRARRLLAVENGKLVGIVTGFDLATFASRA